MNIDCIYRARSALSESALWSPEEQVLYWLDQMRPELHRLDPATGEDRKIEIDLPAQLGGLVPRAGGGLALAASDGISLLGPDLQSRQSLTNPIAALPQASFNDAKCDRQGRLWAGTTDRKETEKIGRLYRIDPDGRTMYHSWSHERVIKAYDIDPATGRASNPRIFATLEAAEGVPDGSTVD